MGNRGFLYRLGILDEFSGPLTKWNKGLARAVSSANSTSARFKAMGSEAEETAAKMQRTAGKIGAGVGVALLASVPAMAASFLPLESALARLGTVFSGTTAQINEDLDESLARARAWSSGHIQSTTSIIVAQHALATAGLTAKESMEGVAVAAQLATATGDQLGKSAQLLASLFRTFGQVSDLGQMQMPQAMADIGDSIASTVKRFQIVGPELRHGLAFVTGQAVSLGLALDEVNVVLGTLSTAGLKGSVGGSAVQNTLLKSGDAVRKLKLDVSAFTDEATGGFTSMVDFIDEVSVGLDRMGLTGFSRLLAVQSAFGQRAAKAVLILEKERSAIRDITQEFRSSSGAAKEMADMIEATAGSRLKIAINNFVNLAQSIGESLAPALVASADAFVRFLEPIVAFVAKGPLTVALFTGLAGAAVLGMSALQAFNAMLVLSGRTAVSAGVAVKSLGAAMATSLGIGLAVAALGALVVHMNASEETIARWHDTFSDGRMNDAVGVFDDLATAAGAAAREIKRAADAGDSVSAGFLSKVFEPIDVGALEGGATPFEVVRLKAEDALAGAFKGITGSEQFDAVSGGTKAMWELHEAGVSTENIMRGLGKATGLFQAAILGTGDATPEVVRNFGLMSQAYEGLVKNRRDFIADAPATENFSEKFEGQNLSESLNTAFHLDGGFLSGNMLGEMFEQAGLDGLAKFHEFLKSDAFQKSFANDGAVLEIVANVATDFNFRSTAEGFERLQAEFADRAGVLKGTFADLGKAMGFGADLSEGETKITNFLSVFGKLESEMTKSGRTVHGLFQQWDLAGKALREVESNLRNLKGELNSLNSAEAKGIANPALAEATKNRLSVLDALIVKEDLRLEGMKKTREEVWLTGEALSRMGEGVTAGQLGAVGEALAKSLDGGSFQSFNQKIFDGLWGNVKGGIVKGAVEGFAAAAGLKNLFSGKEMQTQIKKAFLESRGDVDLFKAKLNEIDPVGALAKGNAAGFFEALGSKTVEWGNTLAGALGVGVHRAKQMADIVASLNPEAAKFASTMAELQTSLIGAGSAERLFGSQAQSVLSMDADNARITAGVRLLEIANQEGLARTRAAQVIKDMVKSDLERRNLAKEMAGIGGSPTDAAGTTTAAEATKSIVADLASVKADAYSEIATELERGVEAAEAIREALAVVSGGQLIPSQISVSGGGGDGVVINRAKVTVNVTGSGGGNQQAMDELERRLRADLESELQQIRAALDK